MDEAAAPTTPPTGRWGSGMRVLLLLALLAAIVVLLAIVGMIDVQAALMPAALPGPARGTECDWLTT
jgi:hypothetical protein